MDGFLLEVPDKPMDNPRRDNICDEQAVEKDALSTDDHHLHQPSWFTHLHKGKKMHPLIEALLEQRLDPTVVTLHAP